MKIKKFIEIFNYAENTNPAIQQAITARKQTMEIKAAMLGQLSPEQQHPLGLQQQQGHVKISKNMVYLLFYLRFLLP